VTEKIISDKENNNIIITKKKDNYECKKPPSIIAKELEDLFIDDISNKNIKIKFTNNKLIKKHNVKEFYDARA